jgi:hypothetical protein
MVVEAGQRGVLTRLNYAKMIAPDTIGTFKEIGSQKTTYWLPIFLNSKQY